jgi:hypothetical protein
MWVLVPSQDLECPTSAFAGAIWIEGFAVK